MKSEFETIREELRSLHGSSNANKGVLKLLGRAFEMIEAQREVMKTTMNLADKDAQRLDALEAKQKERDTEWNDHAKSLGGVRLPLSAVKMLAKERNSIECDNGMIVFMDSINAVYVYDSTISPHSVVMVKCRSGAEYEFRKCDSHAEAEDAKEALVLAVEKTRK